MTACPKHSLERYTVPLNFTNKLQAAYGPPTHVQPPNTSHKHSNCAVFADPKNGSRDCVLDLQTSQPCGSFLFLAAYKTLHSVMQAAGASAPLKSMGQQTSSNSSNFSAEYWASGTALLVYQANAAALDRCEQLLNRTQRQLNPTRSIYWCSSQRDLFWFPSGSVPCRAAQGWWSLFTTLGPARRSVLTGM